MPLTIGRVRVTVLVDRPALARAREQIAAELDQMVGDPVLMHAIIDRIMERAPVVRYVAT